MKKQRGRGMREEWLFEQRKARAMGLDYIEKRNNAVYLCCPGEAAPKRRYLRMGYSIHTMIVWALSELEISQETYFRALALDLVGMVNEARIRSGLEPVDIDFASIVRKDNIAWATPEMSQAISERGRVTRKKKIAVHENDGVPLALKEYPEKKSDEVGS